MWGRSGQVVRVREILNRDEQLGVRGDILQRSWLKLGVSGSHTEQGVEGWSQLRIWVERQHNNKSLNYGHLEWFCVQHRKGA